MPSKSNGTPGYTGDFHEKDGRLDNGTDDNSGEKEVMDFVSSITDTARLRIEENLPFGYVRLKVAEAERRQAEHDIRSVEDIIRELVRNSRDAGAKNILVGFQKEKNRFRSITVIDDGCGIPGEMHELVFEPRITSKSLDFEEDRYGVHGRGMALYSIRSRVKNARIIRSAPEKGTSIGMTTDTSQVPERYDQASIPDLQVEDGVEKAGVGAHNVPRILLEMSIDSRGTDFYLGSFAEILSTLVWLESSGGAEDSIWSGTIDRFDAKALKDAAQRLGIPVSERNAYRIAAGEIRPLSNVYSQAKDGSVEDAEHPTTHPVKKRTIVRERNPLRKLVREDVEEIESETRPALDRVLNKYFLRTRGEARVRRGRGKISISFFVSPVDEDEM